MTIEEIMGEKVELLRAQLAALPDSTASDRARRTADEIRGLLEKAAHSTNAARSATHFVKVAR